MEYKDYYKVLGVGRSASEDEIKSAYRKLAMKFHPDRNQGDKKAEDLFKDINEAYQVLGDSEKRSRFDQLGASYQQWEQHGGAGNFNWNDWFTQSQGSSAGTRVEYGDMGGFEDMFGGGGGFSDFFNMIFGSSRPQRGTTARVRTAQQQAAQRAQRVQASRQNRNVEQSVRITLKEAYQGTERTVQVDDRRLQVKIPAGAKTGTKVRMSNVGPSGPLGQKSDIYLVIEVAEDKQFERKKNDLHTAKSVDLYTAVLGGETEVETMNGKVILTIPTGTQPGQKIRLSNQGMPKIRKVNEFGDLFVQIKVTLPTNLTPRQKELFQELKSS
ncbi:MAG: DnaJ domain-containing protein [Anaerolineaceae bacterium]|nr:DnaJ domain-containing protein [Anaerolineaceae bacterium]